MNRLPIQPIPIDVAFQRLKAAGWTVGEVASLSRWHVTGANGENQINASAGSQAEAWRIALEQATAEGIPGP
jgi:hypothetical protein